LRREAAVPRSPVAPAVCKLSVPEDVAPIHDRQMVILDRANWSAWLQEIGNEVELLRALPAGSLNVAQVR
jgi:putative SOS response-associated peptidase YedK